MFEGYCRYGTRPRPGFCTDYPDSDPQSSTQLFNVTDSIDTETILANLSETLASANAMLSDLASGRLTTARSIGSGADD
jgi:hypothetical protein